MGLQESKQKLVGKIAKKGLLSRCSPKELRIYLLGLWAASVPGQQFPQSPGGFREPSSAPASGCWGGLSNCMPAVPPCVDGQSWPFPGLQLQQPALPGRRWQQHQRRAAQQGHKGVTVTRKKRFYK